MPVPAGAQVWWRSPGRLFHLVLMRVSFTRHMTRSTLEPFATGRFNGVSASAEVKPRASLYTRCHVHSGGFKGAEFVRIGKLQSHHSSVNSLPDTIQASPKSWQFFKTFVSGVKAQHTESSRVAGNVLDYCLWLRAFCRLFKSREAGSGYSWRAQVAGADRAWLILPSKTIFTYCWRRSKTMGLAWQPFFFLKSF